MAASWCRAPSWGQSTAARQADFPKNPKTGVFQPCIQRAQKGSPKQSNQRCTEIERQAHMRVVLWSACTKDRKSLRCTSSMIPSPVSETLNSYHRVSESDLRPMQCGKSSDPYGLLRAWSEASELPLDRTWGRRLCNQKRPGVSRRGIRLLIKD